MLYAIVESGGKQMKTVEGQLVDVDRLPLEIGKKVKFDKVLLIANDDKTEVGSPYLKGVSVDATVTSHFKGKKIIVFKYRAKQRYRVKTGHRQKYTKLIIDTINFPGKAKQEVVKEEEKKAKLPVKNIAAKPKKAIAEKKPAVKKKKAVKTKELIKSSNAGKKLSDVKSATLKNSSKVTGRRVKSTKSDVVKNTSGAKSKTIKKKTSAKSPKSDNADNTKKVG